MNAPTLETHGLSGAVERAPFAAFVSGDDLVQAFSNVAGENGWDVEKVHEGGVGQAIRTLALEPSPQILVVDLSGSEDPRADVAALSEVCLSGTLVIAIGTVNDVTLYRDLAGAGVYDYMVKPVAPQVIREAIINAEDALAAAQEVSNPGEQVQKQEIVTFVGARGGVGATTLAVNSAWHLAHALKNNVALLDLDLNFGTTALSFDLEPGRGLCDALDHPDRVDGLFIERAMIKESENLSILGAEAPLSDPSYNDHSAIDNLFDELARNFDMLLVDLPQRFLGSYRPVLERSSKIVVVADLSLAAIRDTIRLLGFIREAAPEAQTLVVANKHAAQTEVSKQNFEEAVECKLDAVIPLDQRSAIAAAKSAKTILQVAGSGKTGTAIKAMTNCLGVKKVDDDTKGTFLNKFLKRKKEG